MNAQDFIKNKQKELNLTNDEMAKYLDVSISVFKKAKQFKINSNTSIRIKFLKKIAKSLEVEENFLLSMFIPEIKNYMKDCFFSLSYMCKKYNLDRKYYTKNIDLLKKNNVIFIKNGTEYIVSYYNFLYFVKHKKRFFYEDVYNCENKIFTTAKELSKKCFFTELYIQQLLRENKEIERINISNYYRILVDLDSFLKFYKKKYNKDLDVTNIKIIKT